MYRYGSEKVLLKSDFLKARIAHDVGQFFGRVEARYGRRQIRVSSFGAGYPASDSFYRQLDVSVETLSDRAP